MSILDSITQHLDPATIGSIAGKLGIDPEKAKSAVASALPTIVGALAKNTQKEEGAASLDKALGKHDGSVLEQLQAAAPSIAEHGQKILGHIWGPKKAVAEGAVAEKSGLPVADVAALLGTLAPIVMGVIGKKKKDENLDAAGVASALQADADKAKTQSSGLLAKLDADGDGNVLDDIAAHGGNVLGALFKKP